MNRQLLAAVMLFLWCAAASAQIIVPGANDFDGTFNPTSNTQVDLSLAVNGEWDDDLSSNGALIPGRGVYDPEKWAVVFRFSSVNIPSGVTVTFKNYPSRAPVVWLVSGSVTVAGALSLDGANGGGSTFAEPGPGGFRGGRNYFTSIDQGSAGLGPGGGHRTGSAHASGSYGTSGNGDSGPIYGNEQIMPLVGGSGGVRIFTANPGCEGWVPPGAGGGCILIACQNSIIVSGTIRANGGNGAVGCNFNTASGGAGGGIRLIANLVTGSGTLRATGGANTGGFGRIRVEATAYTMPDPGAPLANPASPAGTAMLWPESAPRVSITHVASIAANADPRASFDYPSQDVSLAEPNPLVVRVECQNVPANWNVQVRVIPYSGADFTRPATRLSGGTFGFSVYETAVSGPDAIVLSNGFSAIQARAFQP